MFGSSTNKQDKGDRTKYAEEENRPVLTEKPPVDEDQSMQETDDDDNHN